MDHYHDDVADETDTELSGDDAADAWIIYDIPMSLRELVETHHAPPPRPEAAETEPSLEFQNWLYNWQTKERKVPEVMHLASKQLKTIEACFDHLGAFLKSYNTLSHDFRPEKLEQSHQVILDTFRSHGDVMYQLVTKINTLQLFWFPQNVDQLRLGAYRSIRQPIQPFHGPPDELLVCSMCLEVMSDGKAETTETGRPVIFQRRCTLNPFLKRRCDLTPCRCTRPPACLQCTLDHVLRNGIHAARSSVQCPMCRGEICIYDIQEVYLPSPPPPSSTAVSESDPQC